MPEATIGACILVLSDEARAQLVADAVVAADQPDSERLRISWRSEAVNIPVVQLRVDQVLLNPRSHRIRSQLESHLKRDVIAAEPYGDAAQAAIEDLLRQTEGFQDLRANLKDERQREAGIVTHLGLLVNANRRCVALRDSGIDYIRVGVLPKDAQQKEIDDLELRFQLQEDFREEYSFSNQLLFVEDLLKTYGQTDERVALDMNWGSPSNPASVKEGVKNVQRYVRMLEAMRQFQTTSKGRLPLTWLDDKRQAMIDLDAELEKHGKKDDGAAPVIRNSRFLGMLADVFYRDLREIDLRFVQRYLIPHLETKSTFLGRIDQLLAPDGASAPMDLKGLDAFESVSSKPPADSKDVEPLVVKLATSYGQSRLQWKTVDGEDAEVDRSTVLADLSEAMSEATNDARIDRQAGNLQDRPRKLLEQAGKLIRRAAEAYGDVHTLTEFKHSEFEVARRDVDSALAGLDALSSSS